MTAIMVRVHGARSRYGRTSWWPVCGRWNNVGTSEGEDTVSDEIGVAGAALHALGHQLAACRRAAGLNQERLAALTDYSRSTVANVETGRQRVGPDFWRRCGVCQTV
jgi:DNA-binding XRE family transcriptional regulator